MKKNKFLVLILIFLFALTSVYAATRNSYTKYGKHLMPTYFDPFFITNFENCTPNEYVDWTGTYRYIVVGKNQRNQCEYKTQYNQWLTKDKNEWKDYKICYFDEMRHNELTNALKEHSNLVRSYKLGPYSTTGTKLEYLLYSYEYYGACKLVWKNN